MADTSRLTEKVPDALPTDALKDAGQRLLGLLVQRATDAAIERVDNLSNRLTDVAENGAPLLPTRQRRSEDADDTDEDGQEREGGGGFLSRIGSALGSVKEKVKEAFGGGGGGGGAKKLKVTNIVEDQDIGLPLRTTYNLWTQFQDFPGFMKKVETVAQESDEKINWTAKVFWSRRSWESTIVEQVPDSHIVWRSKGAKGHVDGAVTFTELGPNLTRVMLVLEYWPKGLFERTGNIWRAQGRRARLEFKHFRRHAMTNALLRQDEIEGWRGEIRDSEVVMTHEEALEKERAQESEDFEAAPDEGTEESQEAEESQGAAAEQPAEGDEEEDREPEVAATEDEYDEETAEGEEDDEEPAEDEETAEAEYEDEYDEETAEDQETAEERPSGDGRARGREPVGGRTRRGR
jgi:uncharacterized membrane protein